MIRRAVALAAVAALSGAATVARPPARYTSLVPQFDAVAMQVATAPEAARIAAFKTRIAPLLPDFYRPQAAGPDRYYAFVAKVIADYPQQRAKIRAAAAVFAQAERGAGARFRRTFPDYRPSMPVYLLHSLGEMDGGTREIRGRSALIFGVDVIARAHDAASIGPLFDHELFHTYHAAYFPECSRAWCSLWTEGLAVYVASRMNPGADDRALLLTTPAPIRAATDRDWRNAIATIRTALDRSEGRDVDRMFSGGQGGAGLPERYGYYVGYRLAARLARTRSLHVLATMRPAQVRPLIEAELAAMDRDGPDTATRTP